MFKNTIAALLLMAFIGQSVASAMMSCGSDFTMDGKNMAGSILSADVTATENLLEQHLGHQSDKHTMSDSQASCHSDSCNCGMGHCYVALVSANQQNSTMMPLSLAQQALFVPQERILISLFRPPILR